MTLALVRESEPSPKDSAPAPAATRCRGFLVWRFDASHALCHRASAMPARARRRGAEMTREEKERRVLELWTAAPRDDTYSKVIWDALYLALDHGRGDVVAAAELLLELQRRAPCPFRSKP